MKADTKRAKLLADHAALRLDRSDDAWRTRAKLEQEYQKALPKVALSRCPFTGQALTIALDTAGLDGLFWDESSPVRPLDGPDLASLFAVTGAIRLEGEPPTTPFPCTPGPAIPFVVPRMLLHPDVKAVVSHLRIGAYDAYPIIYFASPLPPMLRRFNDWGTAEYRYETDAAPELFDSVEEEDEDLDFDLAPWIQGGDLLWIAPDDTELKLQTTIEGCPYLGLEGRRDFYWFQNGHLGSVQGAAPQSSKARTKKQP